MHCKYGNFSVYIARGFGVRHHGATGVNMVTSNKSCIGFERTVAASAASARIHPRNILSSCNVAVQRTCSRFSVTADVQMCSCHTKRRTQPKKIHTYLYWTLIHLETRYVRLDELRESMEPFYELLMSQVCFKSRARSKRRTGIAFLKGICFTRHSNKMLWASYILEPVAKA